MMIHQCKVQCHTVDPKTIELTGLEDTGKWLPFIFNMDIIDAAKLSSDEEDSPTYNCTTIFTTQGDTFIIDTPFEEFFKKFDQYNSIQIFLKEEDDEDSDGDLEL
jgi:hypothetical protein